MSSPLVSILIPAYNAERWLAEAVESATAQTWPRKEVIIVDDGSRDKTAEVAESLTSPIVGFHTQDNQGAAAARNKAFSLCQGDYIQWLDADDVLAADKIAAQMRIAMDAGPRTLLSGCWAQFREDISSSVSRRNELWADLAPIEWLQVKMETNAWMAIETWLVNREMCEAAGPWDASLCADDDGEYFSRVVAASDHIRFVEEAKVYCRTANLGSISRGAQTRTWLESQFRSLEKQVELLLSLDSSERSKRACVALMQRWLIHFYPEHPDLVARAHALAAQAGGELYRPAVRAKYRWIQLLFGTRIAKRVQYLLPRLVARSAVRS